METTVALPGVALRVFNVHLHFNRPLHLTSCWDIAPSAGALLQRYCQTMGLTEADNTSGNRDTVISRRLPCSCLGPIHRRRTPGP